MRWAAVRLSDLKKTCKKLSGGEQQRIGFGTGFSA